MATHFVYSGAAGANNGTSWADAWTSLASASGAAAGDTVKVHKTHSQTGLAANINWSSGTQANPVRIICVDKDAADALSTGALVRFGTSNTGPQGAIYSNGITWSGSAAGAAPLFQPATNDRQIHENCTMTLTGGGTIANGGNHGTSVKWINCNVDLSAGTAVGVSVNFGVFEGKFEWLGGTYTCRATQTSLFNGAATEPTFICRGVTFSGTVTNIFTTTSSTTFSRAQFIGCVAPSFTNYVSTALGVILGRIEFENFVAGTLSAPALSPHRIEDSRGTIAATTGKYRTGGANDGEQANEYSWEMISNTGAGDFISWLESPLMVAWIADGAGQTLTVYVASGGTLQDDEVWIEVFSPSEAGTPTALAKLQSTRALALATPADLTTDGSSTWTGAGTTTKQKITVNLAPTISGPVTVRLFLAKASTTMYVDPKLEIA
jgi:hypothetical protein